MGRILNLLYFCLAATFLSSCGHSSSHSEPGSNNKDSQDGDHSRRSLIIDGPILFDSSEFELFPMDYYDPLSKAGGTGLYHTVADYDPNIGKDSAGHFHGQMSNIIFYHKLRKSQHLLFPQNVHLVGFHLIARSHSRAWDRYILYELLRKGNKDEGENDFKVLFISDLSGRRLTQLTPDNMNVLNWRYINENRTIVIRAQSDKNTDHILDANDPILILETAIDRPGMAKDIFNARFREQLEKM